MRITTLLEKMAECKASDLHCAVGMPPMMRVDGRLRPLPKEVGLDGVAIAALVSELFPRAEDRERLMVEKDMNLMHTIEGVGRFRVALYYASGDFGIAFRLVPVEIPTMDEIGLPKAAQDLTRLRNGLVLVTGPNGSGKSTTLAAMINHIARTRSEHITTLEDPIEFVLPHGNSVVHQRELGADFSSFQESLKHLVRHNANVVMVGEMRDLDTIAAAITLAETGHLVFATLHTINAPQTVSRIIDVFPSTQQAQIRGQLAMSLRGILCQSLVPAINGGRVAVREFLINTPAVATMIRENKAEQIHSAMQMSGQEGMVTRDAALKELRNRGVVAIDVE